MFSSYHEADADLNYNILHLNLLIFTNFKYFQFMDCLTFSLTDTGFVLLFMVDLNGND